MAGSERQRSAQLAGQDGATGKGRTDWPDGDGVGDAEQSGKGRLTGWRAGNLKRVDLRETVTPADMRVAQETAKRLARAIRDRRSQRKRADKRGEVLDMRRVVGASLATWCEPLRLLCRCAPECPVKLVAILDVSWSMTVCARVFLAILKGLMGWLRPGCLAGGEPFVLDRAGVRVWVGIGANLAADNQKQTRQLVNGRSVVMILSDGFDTNPPEVLTVELARLKKRGCRIIWLNPKQDWRDDQAIAAGMAAALPLLDLFAAASTLDALSVLETEFARLQGFRDSG